MKRLFSAVILFAFLLNLTSAVAGNGEWALRAEVDVVNTGINEAVLPPELLMTAPGGKYDIALTGPDGQPRSFELYMRDKKGRKEINLQPRKIELTEGGGFIWECKAPDGYLTDIHINILEKRYAGKVHVEADNGAGWQFIARNQAVYEVANTSRATIDVPDGNYNRLRLHFISFDQRHRQKIVPIKNVKGIIQNPGKDYVLKEIDLLQKMRRSEDNDFTELNCLLPGKGIDIQSVLLETGIQFQGEWETGYETIRKGKSQFVLLKSGNISHVDKDKQVVRIRIETVWPAKKIILRLKPDTGFFGEVKKFRIQARLPRIVFSAETDGIYRVESGTGHRKKILRHPGDAKRIAEHFVVFGKPEFNPLFNTQTLVEKYQIRGGPFHDTGYLWNSSVSIHEPGYYKLGFNITAALDKDYKKVRLVKDGTQIPFFFGRYENKSTDLETSPEYDKKNNKTSWIVNLPGRSEHWKYLDLTSSGIFKRTVVFFRKKPGNTGWQRIYAKKWQHQSADSTKLRIRFDNFPRNQKKIKIEVSHGDNQPIAVRSIEGVYRAPAINFLAHESGDYFLYGGNDQVSQADFDLSLVQERLLETLPVELNMGEITRMKKDGWEGIFFQQFKEQGIGLYVILGIVTLFLLIIIVRLFPKVKTVQKEAVKEIDHKD